MRDRMSLIQPSTSHGDLSNRMARPSTMLLIMAIRSDGGHGLRVTNIVSSWAFGNRRRWERDLHQERAARVKLVLDAAGLPVMSSETHIVPLHVGDPERYKRASDLLLSEHGIYIQPINPTVPQGMERLRITPSPHHDDVLIDRLAEALVDVWGRLSLNRRDRVLAAE